MERINYSTKFVASLASFNEVCFI